MKITTTIVKNYAGYSVIAHDENHAVVDEHLFSSRLDAENAKALVEAATAKLTGKSAKDNYAAILAQAITNRLRYNW